METTTKTRLRTLPLQDIAIGKSNPRKVFDPDSLKELSESILEKGILQPLLVRPVEEGFEIVCGERRLKAATLIKLTEVPVQIRDITDEEVREIQLIENLEREDVHPLYEAETLQAMLDTEKYTVADLATKLAKSEIFIIQRLSLNLLIKPWKDAFLKEHINLGKALIVARLTKEGQKELAKNAMDHVGGIRSKAALEKYIDGNISRRLEEAPFDTKSETLVKKAGSCTQCPKRSGANTKLFPDIDSKNRCFDGKCFGLKLQAHLMVQVKTIINEARPVQFLYNSYAEEIPSSLVKLLEKHKISVLQQYEDFELHNTYGNAEAVQGIWLNGPGKGAIDKIYLPKKHKAKMQELSPTAQIERIQKRAKRALELDREKVHRRIMESLAESKELNEPGKLPPQPADVLMNRLCLWNMAKYETMQRLQQEFGIHSGCSGKTLLAKLEKLTDEQCTYMLRLIFFDNHKSCLPDYLEGMALRKLAETCPSVPIKDIEMEQKTVANKRIKRTKERIQELKSKS